jgi:hypothetical protein
MFGWRPDGRKPCGSDVGIDLDIMTTFEEQQWDGERADSVSASTWVRSAVVARSRLTSSGSK